MTLHNAAKRIARGPYFWVKGLVAKLRMPLGVEPLSYVWGFDRGLPLHRFYLEQFLSEFGADIRGHCLEFQNDDYTTRFGGKAVSQLDILHVDHSNPAATIVADLVQPNDIPSGSFDCIVCTHVLHVVLDLGPFVSEMHRILKSGGALLVAVPQVSMVDPDANEIWRFTPGGLAAILARAFGADQVLVRAYGNSLTAAGEIRGLVSDEFSRAQLRNHDERFAVEVCARAVKA
jgi:SAM-dependent methyltransferase